MSNSQIPILPVPLATQIVPRWIHRFDELDLFVTPPILQLLFAFNRRGRSSEFLEPHESTDVVCRGESSELFHLVLVNAADQIVRHSDVESAR